MQDGLNKNSGFETGRIVLVKAGREKNLFMIVVGAAGEEYLLLADGHTRKILSPKKKKIKHIQKTNTVLEDIAQSITDGTVTDRAIRNALSEFCNKGVKNEQK